MARWLWARDGLADLISQGDKNELEAAAKATGEFPEEKFTTLAKPL